MSSSPPDRLRAFVLSHWRNGVFLAFVFDLLALALVTIDIWPFFTRDLSLQLVFETSISVLLNELPDLLLELGTLAGVLPLVLGAIPHAGELSRWTKRQVTFNRWLWGTLHIVFASVLVYSLALGKAMQQVSGLAYEGGQFSYDYHSWHDTLHDYVRGAILASGGTLSLASSLIPLLVPSERIQGFISAYLNKCMLADLGGDLYPGYGSDRLDFNSGAVAPELHVLRKRTNALMKKYQAHVPGSEKSAAYLSQLATDVRQMVHSLFLPNDNPETIHIDFCPGTSRAIETALGYIAGPKAVILSPFEHSSVRHIVNWYCRVDRQSLLLEVKCDLSEEWNVQRDRCVSGIVNYMKDVLGASKREANQATIVPVVILSEVCAATGHIVPIDEILTQLSARIRVIGLKMPLVIIDGAHSGCSLVRPFVAGWDSRVSFYILSGHKWLLSPEPCGIVAYPKGQFTIIPESVAPYDAWCEGRPTPISTGSARSLMSLYAALSLVRDLKLEKMLERAAVAMKQFVDTMDDCVNVVGPGRSATGTGGAQSSMLTIRPKGGQRWEHGRPSELRAVFEKKDLHVSVVPGTRTEVWVRLCFFYFVDSWKLRRLCRIIRSEIVPK